MKPPSFGTMASLVTASWDTIALRSALILTGQLSPAEYLRMMAEKVEAAQEATKALMAGESGDEVIAPFLKAAQANVERLRKKR